MPSPIEELALKDAFKHPKLMILYAAFVGIGWLADRVIPNEDQKDAERWRRAYYQAEAGKDSVQRSKDELYSELLQKRGIIEQQHQTIKTIDSLLQPLGSKAKQILKHTSHEH